MENGFVGSHFESLSQEEMDFVTGATGTVQPLDARASPVLVSIAATVSRVVSGGAASYVVSWVASAWADCRD